jgi:methionine-rich copper-binding protein CopC
VNYKIDKIKPTVVSSNMEKNKLSKKTKKITLKFNEKVSSNGKNSLKTIKIVNSKTKKVVKAKISISNDKIIINNLKLAKGKYKLSIPKNTFKDAFDNMNNKYDMIFAVS